MKTELIQYKIDEAIFSFNITEKSLTLIYKNKEFTHTWGDNFCYHTDFIKAFAEGNFDTLYIMGKLAINTNYNEILTLIRKLQKEIKNEKSRNSI